MNYSDQDFDSDTTTNLVSVHWYTFNHNTSTPSITQKWTNISYTTAWTTTTNKKTTATATVRKKTNDKSIGSVLDNDHNHDDHHDGDDDDGDDDDGGSGDDDDDDGDDDDDDGEDVQGGKNGARTRFDRVRWISVIPRDKVLFAFDRLKTGGLIPPTLYGIFRQKFGNK